MRRILTLLVAVVVFGLSYATAQTKTLSGTVVGADDKLPIPGVSIFVKENPNVGTITDVNGNYSFKNVPANAKTLIFRFVGYQTFEAPITGSVVNVSLVSDNQKLDEVVVTAYGTTKRSSMTTSAAVVGAKELASRPVANVMKALEGQAAGVQVNPGYGAPGSSPVIRVRGFGSINGSNEPLYVVDNIPFDGSVANINPADIESMTVLKDAAATSLYGSRAANGVVMITTKKGKADQFSVNAKASYGVSSRAIPEYSRIGVYDYYPMIWNGIMNGASYGNATYTASPAWVAGTLPATGKGSAAAAIAQATSQLVPTLVSNILTIDGTTVMDPTQIVDNNGKINPNARVLSGYSDLDWFKELSRLGKRNEYSVSASGGSAKSDYFLSVGYLNENGYVIKSDMERMTTRASINMKATDWLKIGVNMSGTINEGNNISGTSTSNSSYINPFFFARNIGPIYPIYSHNTANGEYILDANGQRQYDLVASRASGASNGRHVLAEMNLNQDRKKESNVDTKVYAEIYLPYSFKLQLNGGYLVRNNDYTQYTNNIIGDAAPDGNLYRGNKKYVSKTMNQLLTWNKSFGSHNVDVLAGHESYDYSASDLYGGRSGQVVPGIMELPAFKEILDAYSVLDKDRIESYLSRVNYNYKERYFASVSYRRDGSSRFEKSNRWGDFFSGSLAWNITREDFIKDVSWLRDLKLRLSYGETGNNNILKGNGDPFYYPYQDLYDLNYNNGKLPAGGILKSKNQVNESVTWEVNKQTNIGLDFNIFNSKLSGSVEFFNRVSDNLLFNVPLSVSTGFTSVPQNIGSMYNRGVEVTLNSEILKMANGFSWDATLNATSFINKVTKMPVETPVIKYSTTRLEEGHSIYDYYLRKWEGVDPRDGSSLYAFDPAKGTFDEAGNPYAFRTINGQKYTTDHNYAAYDYFGSSIPKVSGGFTNRFNYKGFNLSVLLTYSLGGKTYDAAYQSLMSYSAGASLHPDILKSWQKPGDQTDVPRFDATKSSQINATSSRWLISSNYLSLKNITLGYTVPSSLVGKIGVKGLSAYISGDNLGFICKRKGLNPQVSFGGTTNNTYVTARIFTFGVNVNL